MARRRDPVSSGRDQKSKLDERGHEVPDSKPLHAALKVRRAPTQLEQLKQLIRSQEFAREFEGQESFDEADDFDVGDDFDPSSPYEEHFEGEFDYYREQRLEARRTETKKRRGRQAAPRDAEKSGMSSRERTPEPTPRSESGSARSAANPGETPT